MRAWDAWYWESAPEARFEGEEAQRFIVGGETNRVELHTTRQHRPSHHVRVSQRVLPTQCLVLMYCTVHATPGTNVAYGATRLSAYLRQRCDTMHPLCCTW